MKPRTIIFSLAVIAAISLVVNGERLGDLNRDSIVLTPNDDVNVPSVTVKDGYPVFEIVVPEGYVEVQVRASLTNFEPGFLLKDGTPTSSTTSRPARSLPDARSIVRSAPRMKRGGASPTTAGNSASATFTAPAPPSTRGTSRPPR